MADERKSLSDDEILTSPSDVRTRQMAGDADTEDEGGGGGGGTDTDDTDSDADTDDA
jgi:hypothetical protein